MCMAFLFFLLMDVVFIEFNFMKYLLLRNIVFTLGPAGGMGASPPPISSLLRHSGLGSLPPLHQCWVIVLSFGYKVAT